MGTSATDAAKAAGAAAASNGGSGHSSHGQADALKKAYETGYATTKKS